MFKMFRKDPAAKLEKLLAAKLEAARDAQRAGQIPRFAVLTAEAEELGQKLDRLRQNRSTPDARRRAL